LNKTNKKLIYFLLFFIFLIFLKIDFRFADGIFCCSDDFDYYIHAETIVEDFDLDYSNQLKNLEDKRFYKNNISAPIGFFGSGLLSSPFLFVGDLFDSYLFQPTNNFMNYKLLIYSVSSIFYFLLTIYLLIKTLEILEIKFNPTHLVIFFSGSGVIYYVFERYSMTHIYESFTSALIIFFSAKFYKSSKKYSKYSLFIPFAIMLGLMVKWVNLYLLVIPQIIKYITKSKRSLFRFRNFYISSSISVVIFLLHSKLIYGKYTIDPRYVYLPESGQDLNIFTGSTGKNIFIEYFQNFLNILFTQEFGLLYFSPILFFALAFLVYIFLNNLRKLKFDKLSFLILLCFSQVFFTVLLWKSPASAYGFRYLFTLSSISIICYFYYLNNYHYKFLNSSLLVLSIFSIFSVLFFETTPATQLSLEPEINSFGKLSSYTSRYYLTGYLNSFFYLESYLKIFTTSFLGVFIFKFLDLTIGKEILNDFLSSYGLPVENSDFQNYLLEINTVTIDKLIFILLFTCLFVHFLYKNLYHYKN